MTQEDYPTDFRALCAELLQPLAEIAAADPHHAYLDLVTRARLALTHPVETQGPTDEELLKLAEENNWNHVSPETFLDIAKTIIDFSA